MVRFCILSDMDTPASLLERIRKPHAENAWAQFVELYTPILYHWVSKLGTHHVDRSDLLQEVFTKLVIELPRFRYDSTQSFRAWLKTLLLNTWRKQLRRSPNLSLDEIDELTANSSHQDDHEFYQFLARRSLELMQRDFDHATWKACWETVVHERSAKEVASELGISPNAVYLARARVLRRLREELKGMLD